jgi:spore coat polysaccharide biosynthesis protein SpsF (cytidylyltransferase family)
VRRLNAKGLIKLKQKCVVEVKVKRVMQNKQINGLTTNHGLAPLPKQ